MARQSKLKVYRTPIGFHDAYVAAPSQKAALEAWGSDVNLFARGLAEQVSEEEPARAALAAPGQIIKRLRGTVDGHVAALASEAPRPLRKRSAVAGSSKPAKVSEVSASKRLRPMATTRSKPEPKPKPRPSRAALEAAERALEDLTMRHARDEAEIRARQHELERERHALKRSQDREIVAAEKNIERERKAHAKALDRWIDRDG